MILDYRYIVIIVFIMEIYFLRSIGIVAKNFNFYDANNHNGKTCALGTICSVFSVNFEAIATCPSKFLRNNFIKLLRI